MYACPAELKCHVWCREYQREVEEHEAAEAMRRQLASDAAAEAQRLAAGMALICSSLEDGSYVACMKCTAASVLSVHALRQSGSLPGSGARRPGLCLTRHARPSAEAAGKAAQAEELRIRFEALSAQKAGLVQQLKQVHCTSRYPDSPISVSRQQLHSSRSVHASTLVLIDTTPGASHEMTHLCAGS